MHTDLIVQIMTFSIIKLVYLKISPQSPKSTRPEPGQPKPRSACPGCQNPPGRRPGQPGLRKVSPEGQKSPGQGPGQQELRGACLGTRVAPGSGPGAQDPGGREPGTRNLPSTILIHSLIFIFKDKTYALYLSCRFQTKAARRFDGQPLTQNIFFS
ncbi:translation initiation factor IF-2-like [Neodiprion lecontei]|uniref:Translation initiation factor IF-2-like n=1 Tax=Neodiprion lecontei TaxID=441921 RepID=A0ABM3G0X2_NEOLC|nr:translation initiation factor IF-2-like [Neodiprion lecontei]